MYRGVYGVYRGVLRCFPLFSAFDAVLIGLFDAFDRPRRDPYPPLRTHPDAGSAAGPSEAQRPLVFGILPARTSLLLLLLLSPAPVSCSCFLLLSPLPVS